MTDQPTPPASTPTLPHPPGPGKNAAPAKTAAPGKRTAPVARDTARSGQPGAETNKDRAIHFDVGPVEIDIPRTLGYYGGISAAVAFGVLEPPIGVSVRNMSPAANAVVFIRRLAEG